MTQVLVLNQDYQAIAVCNVERAFSLVWIGKADMVADMASQKLRSVSAEYHFPSIIRLRKYVRLPYKRVRMTRQNIYKGDGNQCVYCGSPEHLTLDHVIPRAQGGRNTWDNLVTACTKCNAEKGSLTLEETGMEMTQKPFRPSFIMMMSKFAGKVQDEWKPYLLQ